MSKAKFLKRWLVGSVVAAVVSVFVSFLLAPFDSWMRWFAFPGCSLLDGVDTVRHGVRGQSIWITDEEFFGIGKYPETSQGYGFDNTKRLQQAETALQVFDNKEWVFDCDPIRRFHELGKTLETELEKVLDLVDVVHNFEEQIIALEVGEDARLRNLSLARDKAVLSAHRAMWVGIDCLENPRPLLALDVELLTADLAWRESRSDFLSQRYTANEELRNTERDRRRQRGLAEDSLPDVCQQILPWVNS